MQKLPIRCYKVLTDTHTTRGMINELDFVLITDEIEKNLREAIAKVFEGTGIDAELEINTIKKCNIVE